MLTTVAIPELDGMGGLDTMQDFIYDPTCECHALFTRLWYRHTKATGYNGAYRMVRKVAAHDCVQLIYSNTPLLTKVRRANFKLSGPEKGNVTNSLYSY